MPSQPKEDGTISFKRNSKYARALQKKLKFSINIIDTKKRAIFNNKVKIGDMVNTINENNWDKYCKNKINN